jgi:ssDNA thymidine ADP-ribosyltransferase, DarT
MLMTINSGNVPNCPYRQSDIVHFETSVEAVVGEKLTYVFYDYNATLGIATCFSDLKDLDKVDWDLFYEAPTMDGYCKYWNSRADNQRYILRKETRQAEFLVHKNVPLSLMMRVGVHDATKAVIVKRIFDDADVDIPVEIKTDWYY